MRKIIVLLLTVTLVALLSVATLVGCDKDKANNANGAVDTEAYFDYIVMVTETHEASLVWDEAAWDPSFWGEEVATVKTMTQEDSMVRLMYQNENYTDAILQRYKRTRMLTLKDHNLDAAKALSQRLSLLEGVERTWLVPIPSTCGTQSAPYENVALTEASAGVVYTIQEAYDLGYIDHDDLLSISASQGGSTVAEASADDENESIAPLVGSVTARRIQHDIAEHLGVAYGDVCIDRYYGSYGRYNYSCYVVAMDGGGDDSSSFVVDGVTLAGTADDVLIWRLNEDHGFWGDHFFVYLSPAIGGIAKPIDYSLFVDIPYVWIIDSSATYSEQRIANMSEERLRNFRQCLYVYLPQNDWALVCELVALLDSSDDLTAERDYMGFAAETANDTN